MDVSRRGGTGVTSTETHDQHLGRASANCREGSLQAHEDGHTESGEQPSWRGGEAGPSGTVMGTEGTGPTGLCCGLLGKQAGSSSNCETWSFRVAGTCALWHTPREQRESKLCPHKNLSVTLNSITYNNRKEKQPRHASRDNKMRGVPIMMFSCNQD